MISQINAINANNSLTKVIEILEQPTPLKEAIKTDVITVNLELGDRTINTSPLSIQTLHTVDFLETGSQSQTTVTRSANATVRLETISHSDLGASNRSDRLLEHPVPNLVATGSQVAHLKPHRTYRPDSYLTDIPVPFPQEKQATFEPPLNLTQEQAVFSPPALGLSTPAPLQAQTAFNPDPSAGSYQTTVLDTTFKGSINYSLHWYVSSNPNPAPLIVFSHSTGTSNTVFSYLGQYWSSLGYQVLAPQFNDNTKTPSVDRPKQLNEILNNLSPIVAGIPQIAGRVNLQKVGVTGHSLGAYATDTVGGLEPIIQNKRCYFGNPVVDAMLPISPPGLGTNGYKLDQQSFSAIDVPFLVVTGTNDTVSGKPPDWRQDQFRYGPKPKYQVLINGAGHLDYGDAAPTSTKDALKSLSHAFWDTYLLGNTSAQQWLASSDPQTWIGTVGTYSYAVS